MTKASEFMVGTIRNWPVHQLPVGRPAAAVWLPFLTTQIIEGALLGEAHELPVFTDAEGEGGFSATNKVLCMRSNPLVNN